MEEYNRRYLEHFLRRTEVSSEDFVKFIKESEIHIRSYAEIIQLSSDEFVKMVLVNAAFIIKLLIRNFTGMISDVDHLYDKPWMIVDANRDLWLPENQLPFFILNHLFGLANLANITPSVGVRWEERLSVLNLTHEFCKFLLSSFGIQESLVLRNYFHVAHLLDFLRINVWPLKPPTDKRIESMMTQSVVKLHHVGVKLQLGLSTNLFDIRFNNGILEMPKTIINSLTESLLKNLLAFEEWYIFYGDNLINDFMVLLNYLVNSPNDVELLVENGIVENQNRNTERVSTLFMTWLN